MIVLEGRTLCDHCLLVTRSSLLCHVTIGITRGSRTKKPTVSIQENGLSIENITAAYCVFSLFSLFL